MHYFVSVGDMVFSRDSVITLTVIEPVIGILLSARTSRQIAVGVRIRIWLSLIHNRFNLFNAFSEIEHLWIIQYLSSLVTSEMVYFLLQHFSRGQRVHTA